jgi:alcohol dehydrogenase (cytochrome c)
MRNDPAIQKVKNGVLQRRWLLAAAAAVLCGLVAAAYIDGVRWRAEVIVAKAVGRMPDLPWRDLWPVIRPDSGVWPESIVALKNPHWAVSAPPMGPEELAAGKRIFSAHCASCHGTDATGAASWPLTSGHFKYGASDWALFRNIQLGIPGTKMPAFDLPPQTVWQVVGFLRGAELEANPYRTRDVADRHVDIRSVTAEEIERARPGSPDWLTYAGSYDAQRHSPLDQITAANVGGLRLAWMFQLPTNDSTVQNVPLVARGVMFVNLPDGRTWALNASTGEPLWARSARAGAVDPAIGVEGRSGRGAAILGTTLYVPTIDAHLLAIDARDGRLLWDVEVADAHQGYSLTGAPLAVRDAIIVGVAGSDRGIRGYLDAYSPSTGQRLWRFETIPGSNDPGYTTWSDPTALPRGGGLTPTTGSYDPDLDLIYWGVGNPSPAFQGDVRPGDNLYTSSVVAIERRSGHLRWWFQLVPHDERDWGAAQSIVLVAAPNGRKLLQLASRNGFFYTLDRVTGAFVSAVPFVKQSWNRGFTAEGRPIETDAARPTARGTLIYPGHAGATGWASGTYDPTRDLFFVSTRDGYANVFYKSRLLTWPDGAYWGGRAGAITGTTIVPEVRALNRATGQPRWVHRFPGSVNYAGGGLLSTAGGLVFAGDKGRFAALAADTGGELWHVELGGTIDAAPVSYAADTHQFLAIVAGRTVAAFALAGEP